MQEHLVPEASRLRRLRLSEYQQLIEMGAFVDEKVELLSGVIVRMSPQGFAHVHVVTRLNHALTPRLDGRALVQVQSSLVVGPASQPEPDLAVLPLDALATGIATRAHLVIEVADSSLHTDRAEKLPLYATAGFPEVWLVDVSDRAVFVHRGPRGEAWSQVFRVGEEGEVALLAFPDVVIAVGPLFPRAA